MAKRWVVGAVLAALLLAVAGCGGGSDETTTTTTTTESGSGASRLTEEQWTEYQTERDAFVSARDAAAKKLQDCPTTSAKVLSTCIGSSLDDLQAAATTLGDTLTGFTTTVSGQCKDDTASLITYVTPYVNAIGTLQSAIDAGNVGAIPAAEETLQTLNQGGAQERKDFEKSCAPV
jgi:hypothetical protein